MNHTEFLLKVENRVVRFPHTYDFGEIWDQLEKIFSEKYDFPDSSSTWSKGGEIDEKRI